MKETFKDIITNDEGSMVIITNKEGSQWLGINSIGVKI